MAMPRIVYTKEMLEPVVNRVSSWSALLDHFGKQRTGGNYNAFQRRVKKFGLSTAHFKGQGWSKGLTASTSSGVANNRQRNSKVLSQLKAGTLHEYVHGNRLKSFLLDVGVPYACAGEGCGLTSWHGKPLSRRGSRRWQQHQPVHYESTLSMSQLPPANFQLGK